jgi:hypothetical protein
MEEVQSSQGSTLAETALKDSEVAWRENSGFLKST